jgi:hypothetical protein
MRRHYASLSNNATAIILGIPEEPALMRLVLSAFRSNGYEATGDRPVAGGVRHVCVGFHHIIGNPEVVGNLKIVKWTLDSAQPLGDELGSVFHGGEPV